MTSNSKIHFNTQLTQTDPQQHPVLIIGQLRHLSLLKFDDIKIKLEPRVTANIFAEAVDSLHPSPTDACALYLEFATIAALPIKCSRHNTSSRGHALTRLVNSHSKRITESIVVCLKLH